MQDAQAPSLITWLLSFPFLSLASRLWLWPVFRSLFERLLFIYRYMLPFTSYNRMRGHCSFFPFFRVTFFFRFDLTCYNGDFQISIFICLCSFKQKVNSIIELIIDHMQCAERKLHCPVDACKEQEYCPDELHFRYEPAKKQIDPYASSNATIWIG